MTTEVVTKLQDLFQPVLQEFISDSTANLTVKLATFIQNGLLFYARDSQFYITILAAQSKGDSSPDQIMALALLQYLCQLQARLLFEQQQHIQGSLRKQVTDEYMVCLQQFLTQQIARLVTKHNQAVAHIIDVYATKTVIALFELARLREQKQHWHAVVSNFFQWHYFMFPFCLGVGAINGELEKVSLAKALQLVKSTRRNEPELIEFAHQYFIETKQLDVWQELVLDKFSTMTLVRIVRTHGLDLKMDELANDLDSQISKFLLSLDEKWEWIAQIDK